MNAAHKNWTLNRSCILAQQKTKTAAVIEGLTSSTKSTYGSLYFFIFMKLQQKKKSAPSEQKNEPAGKIF